VILFDSIALLNCYISGNDYLIIREMLKNSSKKY